MNEKINAVDKTAKQGIAREDAPLDSRIIGKSGTDDRPKKREDSGRTHVMRHGLLSCDIVRALVRSGESLRSVRRYEKQFRIFFQSPRDARGAHFRSMVELLLAISAIRKIGSSCSDVGPFASASIHRARTSRGSLANPCFGTRPK